MPGSDETTGPLFSYVDLEARIPMGHLLRQIRAVVDDAARSLPEFTKNRDRLLTTDMSREIMTAILAHRDDGSAAFVAALRQMVVTPHRSRPTQQPVSAPC